MNKDKYIRIIKNRIIILGALLLVVCVSFGLSYSNFVYSSDNYRAVEMFANKLKYDYEINGIKTNSITVSSGSNILNIKLRSLNEVSTYYKIVYLNNPSLDIFIIKGDAYGNIVPSEEKEIKLLINNRSTENITTRIDINGGYITNTLNDIIIEDDYKEINNTINIGDRFNYIPEGVYDESNITLSSEYSGYGENQIIYLKKLDYEILNINDDGSIDIIAIDSAYANNDDEGIYLNGSNGYNNGVYLLNYVVNNLYATNKYATGGRNINISDITSFINIPLERKNSLKEYNNIYYPNQWINEVGSNINNKNTSGILGENDDGNIVTGSTISNVINIKDNYMSYTFEDQNYKEIYYDIVKSNKAYWLSSRVVRNNENGLFGLFFMNDNTLDQSVLYDTDNNEYISSKNIKPIINISSSAPLIYNGVWNIVN